MENNEYTVRDITKAAGDSLSISPQRGNYTAQSINDATSGHWLTTALNRYQAISQLAQRADGVLRPVYDGIKLLVNEAGEIVRTNAAGGGVRRRLVASSLLSAAQETTRGYISRFLNRQTYRGYAAGAPINRTDMSLDFVFRCGDYYMPLSVTYNLRAEKSDATSQLVDGPEIVQRIAKRPKTIEVNIRVDRAERNSRTTRYMDIAIRDTSINRSDTRLWGEEANVFGPGLDRNIFETYPTSADLGAMLRDLYENNDVFEIENTVINKVFGVNYVYMKSYDYTTVAGNSTVNISMVLREIDMTANLIAITSDGLAPYLPADSIPVGSFTVGPLMPVGVDIDGATEADKERYLKAVENEAAQSQEIALQQIRDDIKAVEKANEEATEQNNPVRSDIANALIDAQTASWVGEPGEEMSKILRGVPTDKNYISLITGEPIDILMVPEDALIKLDSLRLNGLF